MPTSFENVRKHSRQVGATCPSRCGRDVARAVLRSLPMTCQRITPSASRRLTKNCVASVAARAAGRRGLMSATATGMPGIRRTERSVRRIRLGVDDLGRHRGIKAGLTPRRTLAVRSGLCRARACGTCEIEPAFEPAAMHGPNLALCHAGSGVRSFACLAPSTHWRTDIRRLPDSAREALACARYSARPHPIGRTGSWLLAASEARCVGSSSTKTGCFRPEVSRTPDHPYLSSAMHPNIRPAEIPARPASLAASGSEVMLQTSASFRAASLYSGRRSADMLPVHSAPPYEGCPMRDDGTICSSGMRFFCRNAQGTSSSACRNAKARHACPRIRQSPHIHPAIR